MDLDEVKYGVLDESAQPHFVYSLKHPSISNEKRFAKTVSYGYSGRLNDFLTL